MNKPQILISIISILFFLSQICFCQDATNPFSSDSTKIILDKGSFFKKETFSFSGIKNASLEKHFLGFRMGYSDEFKSVIKLNPYAARELRKSNQYQVLETGGQIIFYGLMVKQFIGTLIKLKQVNNGDFPGNPTPVVDSINLTVGAGIYIYGFLKKKKHRKNAIDIFNNTPIK